MMLTVNDAEISYNETWLFLQFKNYDWNYFTLQYLIESSLGCGNHSDLPFNIDDYSKVWVKQDDFSNRTRGCVRLQIELTKEQHSLLKEFMPTKSYDYYTQKQ